MAMFGQAQGAMEMAQDALRTQEEMVTMLRLLVDAQDTQVMQLGVTNVSTDPGLQKDFPVAGSQRQIIHRIAAGGLALLAAGVPTDVLPPNVNRLGGTIVNWGETTVVLTLASAATDNSQEGLAEVVLNPNGGSWDFRLGNLTWCGAISAEALAGEGKLSVAEV